MVKWIAISAGLYVVFAIAAATAAGDFTLVALPLGVIYGAVERIRRPPRWRLARALRSLRLALRERVPAIVESRTMEWSTGVATVYLVCSTDDEIVSLRSQLAELRAVIAQRANALGVPESYLAAMRLWPVARSAIEREGGWFGFDHNVAFPGD